MSAKKNVGNKDIQSVANSFFENRDLRNQMGDRVDVLSKVKKVCLVAGVDAMPTKMVAEFYGVDPVAVSKCRQNYKAEFEKLGLQKIKSSQWKLRNIQVVERDFTGNGVVKLVGGGTTSLTSGYNIFFSPEAVLRVGMVMDESPVAEKLRKLLAKEYIMQNPEVEEDEPVVDCKSDSNVTIFSNDAFGDIRTVTIDGDPWFVAVDVCRALEIEPTATRRLDDDEKVTLRLTQCESARTSEAIVINEPGLYSLVLGSRKPEAKTFKRWIVHEVLPTIRKTGGFVQDDREEEFIRKYFPSFAEETKAAMLMDLRTQNKVLKEENKLLENKNKLLAEEVFTWDNKSAINALVRRYAYVRCGNFFGQGWIDYKKQLLYKHGINLDSRVTHAMRISGKKTRPPTLDMLEPEEAAGALATAIAMCEQSGVNISGIINKIRRH